MLRQLLRCRVQLFHDRWDLLVLVDPTPARAQVGGRQADPLAFGLIPDRSVFLDDRGEVGFAPRPPPRPLSRDHARRDEKLFRVPGFVEEFARPPLDPVGGHRRRNEGCLRNSELPTLGIEDRGKSRGHVLEDDLRRGHISQPQCGKRRLCNELGIGIFVAGRPHCREQHTADPPRDEGELVECSDALDADIRRCVVRPGVGLRLKRPLQGGQHRCVAGRALQAQQTPRGPDRRRERCVLGVARMPVGRDLGRGAEGLLRQGTSWHVPPPYAHDARCAETASLPVQSLAAHPARSAARIDALPDQRRGNEPRPRQPVAGRRAMPA